MLSAAFLEGDMEKTMYIEWPDGMVELDLLRKKKEIYSIKQMKLYVWKLRRCLCILLLFKKHLIEVLEMTQSLVDPCMFYKKEDDKVTLIVLCHVDDNAICGSPKWIAWFKEVVKKRFGITDLGRLRKHLGIWYEWKEGER
jgi:hypothetical protein